MGLAHVVAASVALLLGGVVLARRKGTRRHVGLGRLYAVVLAVTCVSALLVYDISGRPNAFHVLAVVSLLTLAAGLAASPRRLGSGSQVHGRFMVWSFLGLAMAGLAQGANALWPTAAPWPVLGVVAALTALGLVGVPHVARRPAG